MWFIWELGGGSPKINSVEESEEQKELRGKEEEEEEKKTQRWVFRDVSVEKRNEMIKLYCMKFLKY